MSDNDQLKKELEEIKKELATLKKDSRAYKALEEQRAKIEAQLIGAGAIAQGTGGIMIEGGVTGSNIIVGNSNTVNSDNKKNKG